ncbi:hypothetical protein ACEQPO_24590 [Bacillus sp. SL00103]
MSAKLYAMESAVYRTVGLFEQRMGLLSEEDQRTANKLPSPFAEYAIECSLCKSAWL